MNKLSNTSLAAMNPFISLILAITFEVVATSSLKASAGFSRLLPSVVVVGGYAAAFYLLSISLKTISVSVAYAIWSGLGTTGVVLVGTVLFHEKLTVAQVAGIALIIAGVVVLNSFGRSIHS